ncbi:MAG: branched-chain amino acid aminotransferase [Bdellovibrionota bacterium]
MVIPVTKNTQPKEKPQQPLGFGRYFSDHMFISSFNRAKGWHDSKVIPYSPLAMDPAAAVFHYAQALFEGLKAFRQKNNDVAIFRPEFNAKRMAKGASRLCMPEIPAEIFIQGIETVVAVDSSWVPKEKGSSLYIRPTLIGSEAFLGVRPADEYLFFVILSPVGAYYASGAKPVKIWVERNQIRAAQGGLGETKAAANYAAALQAATLARPKGFDQVLWLDAVHKKYIEEVGTMNVFFVLKKEIVTPGLQGTILPGGLRECSLELLKSWGKTVSERQISINEVAEAYAKGELLEVFGTGTAAVISPVGELVYGDTSMTFKYNETSIANRLHEEITSIQYGEKPDTRNWLHKVSFEKN